MFNELWKDSNGKLVLNLQFKWFFILCISNTIERKTIIQSLNLKLRWSMNPFFISLSLPLNFFFVFDWRGIFPVHVSGFFFVSENNEITVECRKNYTSNAQRKKNCLWQGLRMVIFFLGRVSMWFIHTHRQDLFKFKDKGVGNRKGF